MLQVAIGVQAQLPIVDSSIPLPLRRTCVPYDACSPHGLSAGRAGKLLPPASYVYNPPAGSGGGTVPTAPDPVGSEDWG